MRAQEEERARIARDLHDEANQARTGVLRRLEATAQHAPEEMRAELRETQQAATQAIEELLRIARELRPSALDDHGLAAALRSKIGDFERQTGVTTQARPRAGELDSLGPEEQIAVYRVVQESLSNVAQHAEPPRRRSRCGATGREVVARVADDGARLRRPAVGRRRRAHRHARARADRRRHARHPARAPGHGTVLELRIGGTA